MKRSHAFTQVIIVLGVASLTLYQNCSKVQFTPAESDLSSEATDTPLVIKTEEVKVGAQNVPPLKLFFVVDNSYTMKENQLNLSQSFQKMFDVANGKSLANFETTAFLINTAQSSPHLQSANLLKLQQLQYTSTSLSPSQYSQARTALVNSGAIPGDVLGFKAHFIGSGVQFTPAPVLGFQEVDGQLNPQVGIYKAAQADPLALAQEFQARLGLLDSRRIPLLTSGEQTFHEILDKESGLCAVSRILKNHNQFLVPGEQAAFVIVSDEDESDPAGLSCVQSINSVSQQTDLIKGKCEERSSTLTYTVTKPGVDSCKVSFQNGYKYKYSWSQDTIKTNIKYRKLATSGSYSTPQTKISYTKLVNSYFKKYTSVSYYLKTCTAIIADGIKIGENCSYPQSSGKIEGDYTSNCASAALQLNSKALTSDVAHPLNCSLTTVSTGSCSNTDINCIISPSYVAGTATVIGNFTSDSNCKAEAMKISGAIVDSSQPLSCALTTPKTGSGLCPSNYISLGCTQVSQPTYSLVTISVDGDYTTSQTVCYNKAAQQAGAAIDSGANAPVCTKAIVTESKIATGSLGFTQALDQGASLPVGDCGNLKNAVLTEVQRSYALANSSGACLLTDYNSSSTSLTLNGGDCQAIASSHCSSSSTQRRNCSGQLVAGTATVQTTDLPILTRDVNCSDLCSAQNQLCAATLGVTIEPSTTVIDYLKARYGANTTCSVKKVVKTVGTFVDRLDSERASLCVGTPTVPQYLVQEGPSYTLNEEVKDFVAGTYKDASNAYVPQHNLTDFIVSTSAQLFGEQKPIVSVFVRTPEDGVGVGGSLGVTYEQLAQKMSGTVERISSPDYSTALVNLSDIIRSRLERSFQIAQMAANQKVSRVWLRSVGSNLWVELEAGQWTSSGNTVTIGPAVALEFDDSLKFEFY